MGLNAPSTAANAMRPGQGMKIAQLGMRNCYRSKELDQNRARRQYHRAVIAESSAPAIAVSRGERAAPGYQPYGL